MLKIFDHHRRRQKKGHRETGKEKKRKEGRKEKKWQAVNKKTADKPKY